MMANNCLVLSVTYNGGCWLLLVRFVSYGLVEGL